MSGHFGLRLSRRALAAALLTAGNATALGRIPEGGVLRLAIPWAITRLDPHALDDPIAALFAHACCDSLYDSDAAGRPYPALATDFPKMVGSNPQVRLRAGLRSARGRSLTASDVVASLQRARGSNHSAWLRGQAPRADSKDPLLVHFPGATAATLAAELATPLLAVVPRDFSAAAPDGTGAFAAELRGGALLLSRNPYAARGAAFLERIEVRTALDLAEALRAFESASVDVGWLGSGLHRPRSDGLAFRGTEYGWAVLRSGKQARSWGAPGVMQQLLDGIDPQRLRHLGLEGLARMRGSQPEGRDAKFQAGWAGGPATLYVCSDAPQLMLIARTLAAALERPSQSLTVKEIPRPDFEQRRAQQDFSLMLDFVRRLGPSGPWTQLALLSAQDPALASKPARVKAFEARELARSLTLGVVGELWVGGAHAPSIRALTGWQLGGVWRIPNSPTLAPP